MEKSTTDRQHLLKMALVANALFSTISGLILLFAHRQVARLLGLPERARLASLGIGLLAFAVTLILFSRKSPIRIADAWIAVILDLAWVIGSYPLLFLGPFSSNGKWVLGILAEVVMAFAVLQWLGIRRIRKGSAASNLAG